MSASCCDRLTVSDIRFICDLVRRSCGIELNEQKSYLIESRLDPIARQCQCASVSELIAQLKKCCGSALCQRVVEAMTTNETSFFRDAHFFEGLRRFILPELIRRRAATRSLAIWSAACSTGQEVYSLAMVIREYFADLVSWNLTILGTDISRSALDQAAAGRYCQMEINRGLPAPLLVKYFERHGLTWTVKQEIRSLVDFLPINLCGRWPSLPVFDLVLLRNVLIYFSPETKRSVLQKVQRQLAEDGFLMLGSTETLLGLNDSGFQQVLLPGACVYQRTRPGENIAQR